MGVWESAEDIKPPSASTLLHAGYPPVPQLHGFAKGRCAIKNSPFAGRWEMGSLKVLWPTGRSGSAWYAVAAQIYLACSSFELPETCRSSTAPYDTHQPIKMLAVKDRSSAFAAGGVQMGQRPVRNHQRP